MPALESPGPELGAKAPGFTLPATDGRTLSLADAAGERGTVVTFICNHCPYVKAIASKLTRDAADLAKLGVATVAICSNDAETYPEDGFDQMAAFAKKHAFPFPYLQDESQEVARAYGAVCTPDFFGFDADLRLRYRGRLDSAGPRPNVDDAPRELYEAMKRVAETGEAPSEQVPSIGCSIKWRAA